jgi:hypothetical protein
VHGSFFFPGVQGHVLGLPGLYHVEDYLKQTNKTKTKNLSTLAVAEI